MNNDDEGMDKYGVDETKGLTSAELEKLSAKGCPICGKPITRYGDLLMCPEHGSEPFERG